MTLSAAELDEVAAELVWQDRMRGLPPEPWTATVRRAAAMEPTKARMLVVRAIADTVEPGTAWTLRPERIAEQIARAAAALKQRREAAGQTIAYPEAVQRVTPEVEWLAGGAMPPLPNAPRRAVAVPMASGRMASVMR